MARSGQSSAKTAVSQAQSAQPKQQAQAVNQKLNQKDQETKIKSQIAPKVQGNSRPQTASAQKPLAAKSSSIAKKPVAKKAPVQKEAIIAGAIVQRFRASRKLQDNLGFAPVQNKKANKIPQKSNQKTLNQLQKLKANKAAVFLAQMLQESTVPAYAYKAYGLAAPARSQQQKRSKLSQKRLDHRNNKRSARERKSQRKRTTRIFRAL